jgi:regulator of PEP synthase PpsR (kinase-PPPase family)
MRRKVFIISESTGITAETIGHSLLSQFEGNVEFKTYYTPFTNSVRKAEELVRQFDRITRQDGVRPIVIATMMEPEVAALLRTGDCLYLELFDSYLPLLEEELGVAPSCRVGLSHGITDSARYEQRMSVINFTIMNDDGMQLDRFGEADVILLGVSRSGKTPTCLYLAMHFGLRAANYPLTQEDFQRGGLPEVLLPHSHKMFGLTIAPERLHKIREERRPESLYASLSNCRTEVRQARGN